MIRGEIPAPGEATTPKLRDFWDMKLQIFDAEGAENFEKIRIFIEKSAIFGVLRENLTKFWWI